MVKIRLTRLGKKKSPFYRIVVADCRSPRDGKFIEQLGTYDTRVNPPTIVFDVEKAKEWMKKGAQMTDVVTSILAKAEDPKLNKATDYSKSVSKKKLAKEKLAKEAPAEAPKAEEPVEEAPAETPKEETVEAPAETKVVAEDTPVAEAPAEETPAEPVEEPTEIPAE